MNKTTFRFDRSEDAPPFEVGIKTATVRQIDGNGMTNRKMVEGVNNTFLREGPVTSVHAIETIRIVAGGMGMSKSSVDTAMSQLKRAAKYAKKHSDIRQITPEDLRDYLNWVKDPVRRTKRQRIKNTTINVYIQHLQIAFEVLIKEGLTLSNPARALRRLKPEKPGRYRYGISAEAQRRLLQIAGEGVGQRVGGRGRYREEMKDYIFVCLATGIRPAEAQKLLWDDVRLPMMQIVISPNRTKTRRPYVFPMTRRLCEYFAALKAKQEKFEPDQEYVFPKMASVLPKAVREYFLVVAASANLPHVSLRYLRHAAAQNWHRAGVSLIDISKMLNHSNLAHTQRYLELDTTDPKHLADIAVEALLKSKDGG